MNANSVTPETCAVFRQNPDVVCADVAGETILLHGGSGASLEIDEIGRSIWDLLAVPQSLASLAKALMRAFDVDEAVCIANTEPFLQYLAGHGFLVRTDED